VNYSLTLLTVLWLLFGFSHSFLADLKVKNTFYRLFGLSRTSYRVFYNISAFVFLTAILYLQIVTPSQLLYQATSFTVLLSLSLCLFGAILMMLCVIKYFKQLSGIFKESTIPKLETGGLHRFVRHPLYFGTIVFVIGLLLYFPYIKNAVAAFIVIVYTIVGAVFEEKKLVQTFGNDYKEYQQAVPMIFPWQKSKTRTSGS
jgi:methanethiol S-methyltransferase